MFRETFPLGDERFLELEDDTTDAFFMLNVDQIVGIEWKGTL